MNNGSLPIKGNNSRTTTSITDPSLRASLIRTSNQETPRDLTDVSILSVGLTRFQHHDHGMLTDDDDDNEIVRLNWFNRLNGIKHKILWLFRSKPVMKKMMTMTINDLQIIREQHY